MPRPLRITLIVLAVLFVILLIVDRVSVRVAQSMVADRIQSELRLARKPSVVAHGYPFLTQALGGRYSDVEVTAEGVETQSIRDFGVVAHLQGLHAPISDLAGGDIQRVPVDRVVGSVTVPYAEVARVSRVSNARITREGDALRVRGQVTFAGQRVNASGLARVEARDGSLVVTVTEGAVEGVQVPPAALGLIMRGLSFMVPVTSLPFGLSITGVEIRDDALVVSAEARDVVLTRLGFSSTR